MTMRKEQRTNATSGTTEEIKYDRGHKKNIMRVFILPLRLVSDANHQLPVLFFPLFFPFFFHVISHLCRIQNKKEKKDEEGTSSRNITNPHCILFFSLVYLIFLSFSLFFFFFSFSSRQLVILLAAKRLQSVILLVENLISRRTDDAHGNQSHCHSTVPNSAYSLHQIEFLSIFEKKNGKRRKTKRK